MNRFNHTTTISKRMETNFLPNLCIYKSRNFTRKPQRSNRERSTVTALTNPNEIIRGYRLGRIVRSMYSETKAFKAAKGKLTGGVDVGLPSYQRGNTTCIRQWKTWPFLTHDLHILAACKARKPNARVEIPGIVVTVRFTAYFLRL